MNHQWNADSKTEVNVRTLTDLRLYIFVNIFSFQHNLKNILKKFSLFLSIDKYGNVRNYLLQ